MALVTTLHIIFFSAALGLGLSRGRWRQPDMQSLFAFSCLLTGVAHAYGLLPQQGPVNNVFLYASLPHADKGAWVFLLGSAALWSGMEVGKMERLRRRLPVLKGGERSLPGVFLALTALILFFGPLWLPKGLGLPGTFFFQVLPLGIIFYLTRRAALKEDARVWWMALLLVVVFTGYKVLFAYLRMEMLMPTLAFLLGVLTSEKLNFRELLRPRYIVVYIWLILFVLAFPWIKNNRKKFGTGEKRIEFFRQEAPGKVFSDYSKGETVLTRMAVINQLSNVVRVAEEDGYYKGQTLAYWRYVFIPRVLWPDKPKIATGAWFAHKVEELDEGKRPYDGKSTWSVNMTIPGEWFLNFGWPGLIAGCFLFGLFAQTLWHAAPLYAPDRLNDLPGQVLSFFLLQSALFQFGADMEFAVNLVVVGLFCLLLGR